jgi:hypothetical protein
VKPTGNIASTASTSKTGLFAALCGLLYVKGISAPEISQGTGAPSRRLMLLVFATALGALAFTTAPALAAGPPEAPVTVEPAEVRSTSAVLQGVVDPLKVATVSWFFEYKAGAVCTGGSITPVEGPAEVEALPVGVRIEGLTQNTEYTVCLVAENEAKETTAGPPITFTTALTPEAPETLSPAKLITATTATFEGILNPKAAVAAKDGWYFAYAPEPYGPACVDAFTTPLEPEALVKAQQEEVKVTGLEPSRKYEFCMFAVNAAGEATQSSNEVPFETLPSAPTVEAQSTSAVTPFAARLEAVVNANNQEVTKCEFEYGTEASLATPKTVPCEQATLPGVYGGQAATASVSGLTPDVPYYYRVLATNATGVSNGTAIASFPTLTAEKPVVEPGSEKISEVGAKDAKLQAQVNPNYQATAVVFEYATSEAAVLNGEGTKVSGGSLPAGFGAQTVGPVDLGGVLQSSTVYYYRVVATNATGATPGEVEMFTTFPPSDSALPDDRAYELVSDFPAGTGEEAYVPAVIDSYIDFEEHGIHTGDVPFQVASDGEAVVYPGDPPPTGGSGGSGEGAGTEYLARRGAGGGWTQVDLHPPGVKPDGAEYLAFSSDLSVGIFWGFENQLGGGPGKYEDFYSHVTAGGADGEYEPFYTGTPPNRTVNEFDLQSVGPRTAYNYAGGNTGTGAVPAFSDVLFEANDALATLNVAAAGGSGEDPASHLPFKREENLYDRVGGGLYLVNVLPDGRTEANAAFGQAKIVSGGHGGSNLISPDASRIFWTSLEGIEGSRAPKALYVRENDTQPQSPLSGPTGEECTVSTDACTVQLDASQGGPESGGGVFWAASSDTSRVFFTDCNRLTADSTAVPTPDCQERLNDQTAEPATGSDLYEYDFDRPLGARLTDLTAYAGEPADVRGVLGSSVDGEYIYFVAGGILASNENADKGKAEAGHDNLYVRHGATTTFIATLSPEDGSNVAPLGRCGGEEQCQGDWQADGGHRTAEVTPDGQGLVFMSDQPLTGYDNAAQQSNKGPIDEVFVYDAQSEMLRCVSCNPSGEPPVLTEFNTHYFDQPIGGFIPTSRSVAGEQPLVISEDGDKVFFDSGEPLLPTATNGWLNVYEWERAGTPGGSCPEGAPGGGCVYLLSSGTDPENSYLIGADASGDNAFFVTRAQLTPADRGNEGDVVYDARVDGVQPPAAAVCEGTGCQGVPPTPPIFATPSSVTFNGIGNFPPPGGRPINPVKPKTKTVKCAKGKHLSHNKCVKSKHKKKKKSKAKKSAHTNRRAKS